MAAARRLDAPALAAGALLLALALGGCSVDERHTVVGTAHRPDPTAGPTRVAAEDPYYDRMGLDLGTIPVVGPDGESADLADGDTIEVVIDGSCAESSPVQCPISEIRIIG
jgi:ABC-type nitrate/sulfonate/bicarbonate transport system substrate-binding protein